MNRVAPAGRRRRYIVALVALAALVAVAASGAASPSKSVTNYIAYVGGKVGKANPKLSPIKIGYVNQEGGPIVIGKTADNGVAAAAQFVNTLAGGIGGHRVVLVKCFIASSEEEGQKCGQKFANDKKIVAVVTGAVAIGSESLYAAIGKTKPVIVGVSVNPVDVVRPNAAVLYGDSRYILAPYATFARDVLHVKSASLVFPEGAGLDAAAAGQTTAFQAAGIPIKKVSYPANTADLSVPLIAAGAQSADLVMPVINPNECGKFEKAIKALNIPDEQGARQPDLPDSDHDPGARRLPEMDLRDRQLADGRHDRSGGAAVPEDHEADGSGEADRRPVDERRLRGDGDAREVPQQARPDQHHVGRDHQADEGVQGADGPRLAEHLLRQVPEGAGGLQRQHPVLPLRRQERLQEGGRLGAAAQGVGRPVTANPIDRH